MHRNCERKIPIRIARVLCTRIYLSLSLSLPHPVKVALSLFLPLATLRFSYSFAMPFFLFTGSHSFGPSLFHARSSRSPPTPTRMEGRGRRGQANKGSKRCATTRQLQVRVLVVAREASARSKTTKRQILPVYPETFYIDPKGSRS